MLICHSTPPFFEIETLDLSNFDTSNAIEIGNMFHKCYKLKYKWIK